MGTEFVSRKDISVLTGLGKAAVARLVEWPEFPSGTWINSPGTPSSLEEQEPERPSHNFG